MPPKNVKKAKKLFEKMKKEKEEKDSAAGLEASASDKNEDSDVDGDFKQATPDAGDGDRNPAAAKAVTESNEVLSTDGLGEPKETAAAVIAEDHLQRNSSSHTSPESAQSPTPKPRIEQLHLNKSESNEEEQPSVSLDAVADAEQKLPDDATEDASTPDGQKIDSDTLKSSASGRATEPAPSVDHPATPSIEASETPAQTPSAPASNEKGDFEALQKLNVEHQQQHAEAAALIASLRQENEDLRLQNEQLRSEVVRLEGELEISKRADLEVSLSPPYPHDTTATSFNSISNRRSRDRSSSFVEAELYSQVDNSQAISEAMAKWRGFQLDMRDWQNSSGIGPIVSL